MKSLFLTGCLIGLLHLATAINPFVGLLRQGKPCFEVKPTKSCSSTLIGDTDQLENPNYSGNSPRTWAFLFTPENRDVAEPLHLCGGKLPPNTSFDKDAQTVVIIHGWLDGVCRSAWMREMKEQFFERGRYNVILMDWTWGNTPDYKQASQNCKIVGEQCGIVINNIMNQTGIGPENFHVVGHSFGGIATGFCGRKVQQANKGSLRRITPLDPALAPFANAPPEQRVTYKDAELVDVIHSNGGNCSIFTIGDSRALGHADFYPNGGTVQSSCYSYIFEGLRKGDFLTSIISLIPQFCFHLQAIQFFKVSINPKGCELIGVESSSYKEFKSGSKNGNLTTAIMGLNYEDNQPNDDVRRTYYLDTGFACPYYNNRYLPNGKAPSKCKNSAGLNFNVFG